MKLDKEFEAKLQRSDNRGSWTYVVMPDSAEFFGTKGHVRVKGLVDGRPFEASFMAMGDGVQMLPLKAETRQAIGKEVGDNVTVRLTERIK